MVAGRQEACVTQRTLQPLSITPSTLEIAGIFDLRYKSQGIRDDEIRINMLRQESGELPKNESFVLNIEI